MKKKIFIMILLIISFIILSTILFMQLHNLGDKSNEYYIQTEKISSHQNLDMEENYVTNSNIETTVSSSTYSEDIRKKDIQNRIEMYGKNEVGIPVLMYHFFYDSSLSEKGKDNNYLDISKFGQQLNYLKENDFFFPTFEELSQFIDKKIELPKKSVILTIDDGDESFFRLAVPIIEKYQVPVTSFVITSECDSNKIKEYQSDYVHFESHSNNLHQAGKNGKGLLVNLNYEKAHEDIEKSVEILNSKEAFCYPFGHYNSTSKQVLKDIGYKVAFTTNGGKVKSGMNHLELPRVRILKDDSLSSFITKVSN